LYETDKLVKESEMEGHGDGEKRNIDKKYGERE
jgi:hypothetical protein